MAAALQNISPGLIHEAKLGNKDSMNRLAELAGDRLYAYIFRLTLDQTITQDILQETILFMIQSLNELEHVDHFWGWLFRTAMGKVQHYYRDQQRRKTVELSEDERLYIHNRVSADFNDGLTELLRKELSDAVFMGMKKLKLKYRNVLMLRCFENMDYAQIATVMNTSELRSRVMFFRAKTSLRRHLAMQGFGKYYFLIALALFGIITTSAKAASSATVTASSLSVGFTASLIAVMLSKIGISATAAATAIAFIVPHESWIYLIPYACFAVLFVFFVYLASIYSN
ncbi:MAG: sigma-70 family RNA polymerase sigma factor [Sedimentisphaerales bacterium]|jgi:RNA polymerase sigma-70 factor (ECF subfamily)